MTGAQTQNMEHAASLKSTTKSNALISNDSTAGATAELVPNDDTAIVGPPVFCQDDPSSNDDSNHDPIPECAPDTSVLDIHNSPTATETVPALETSPTKVPTPTPKPNIATKTIENILIDISSNCRPGPHLAPGPAALDQTAVPLPAGSGGITTAPSKGAGTDPPNKLGMAGAQTQNIEHAASLKSNELIPDDSTADATNEQVTNDDTADVGPPESKSARPSWKAFGQDDSSSNDDSDHDSIPECAPDATVLDVHNS